LAHEWNPIGLARKRISEIWRIHKSQITGEGSFNGARDIVIAALN
jgi:hypothetical protein